MLADSPLQKARRADKPSLPSLFSDVSLIQSVPAAVTVATPQAVAALFPHISNKPKLTFTSQQRRQGSVAHRVGVVLSGGQAPGGHNVIIGLFDALKKLHQTSKLFGFLNGPSGIIKGEYKELTAGELQHYLNTGGFDLIGSGRTKIETDEQLAAAKDTVEKLQLDGLVIIGGDDSNTNAAILAEYFRSVKCPCTVVGAPKTIDGDLRSDDIEVSFGFDTACKTFSEIIGNIARDALSAKKYYHFVKLMGRSASHITLECALQTHPNLALIAEEIAQGAITLSQVTSMLADVVCQRAAEGKDYGIVLIPEGLIEFIPDCQQLIRELNACFAAEKEPPHQDNIAARLSPEAASCLKSMPKDIQTQLLLDRDPHGNIQVSKIETERLFIAAVSEVLQRRREQGLYQGKFNPQPHFLGYEGRSCFPSLFDCNYCYTLGHVCALLIDAEASGYIAFVKGLTHPVEEWEAGGAPLTSLIHLEERKGSLRPVIRKALVALNSKAFKLYAAQRSKWTSEDLYRSPGPIQFFGPDDIVNSTPMTLI